jgi:kynureninase
MLMMVMAVSLVAVGCTKSEEYGCTCTHTYLNGGGVDPTVSFVTAKNRDEAAEECASHSNVDSSNITHSCSLD